MAPSPGRDNMHVPPAEDGNTSNYSAANAVLNTIELLEQFLLQLPMKDILFGQRVNKTWKACIDDSTKLQKALLFLADGEPTRNLKGREFSTQGVLIHYVAVVPGRYMTPSDDEDEGADQQDSKKWVVEVVQGVQHHRDYELAEQSNLVHTRISPLLLKEFGLDELAWQIQLHQSMMLLDQKHLVDEWSFVSPPCHGSARQAKKS